MCFSEIHWEKWWSFFEHFIDFTDTYRTGKFDVFLPILRKISKFQKQSWKFYTFKNPTKVNFIFFQNAFFFLSSKIELSKGKIFLKKSTFLWNFTDWYINSKMCKKNNKNFRWESSQLRDIWIFFLKTSFFGSSKIQFWTRFLGGGFSGMARIGFSMEKSFFEGSFFPPNLYQFAVWWKLLWKSFF